MLLVVSCSVKLFLCVAASSPLSLLLGQVSMACGSAHAGAQCSDVEDPGEQQQELHLQRTAVIAA